VGPTILVPQKNSHLQRLPYSAPQKIPTADGATKGRNRASKRAQQSGHGYGTYVFPVLPHGQTCRQGAAAQDAEESVEDLVQGRIRREGQAPIRR
jgi:hypothetical protein